MGFHMPAQNGYQKNPLIFDCPESLCSCRILKRQSLEALSSTVQVAMFRAKQPTTMSYQMTTTSVLWPHELFAWMWEKHHSAFVKNILGGSAANIEEFWKHMPERPGMRRGSFKKWCISIAIHGDGVAVSNIRGKASKQVDCISWPSLLAKGQTRFTTFFGLVLLLSLSEEAGIWFHLDFLLEEVVPKLASSMAWCLASRSSTCRTTSSWRLLCSGVCD